MSAHLSFRQARAVLVAGFAADADPRTTLPSANQLFHPQDRVSGQSADQALRGHAVYLRFVDNAGVEVVGATVDFTTWFLDTGSAKWISVEAETGAASSQVFTSSFVGDLFVQLNALHTVGSAVSVQVWITELAISPV